MNGQHPKRPLGALSLAALGIVYGDIGTSPLYAFQQAFADPHGLAPTHGNILATLSTLFWAITLIVAIKYVGLVLRFDNQGEGGVLALQALAQRHTQRTLPRLAPVVATLGVFAAALFYGDAIITPAISVLSAVEGIHVATPHLAHWVIPISVGVLVGLFMLQRFGTAQVGRLFGPLTLLWFLVLGALGLHSILQTPLVLQALNPLHALVFAQQHPAAAFVLLSAVFLAITGGEALYADMGHFGAKPIRLAWYGLVWPALILNYFGQGALLMRSGAAVQNPFYLLAPEGWLLPLVVLATIATVIASQATISGAYSLTQQAIQLGYWPRMRILHTSDVERGQIYLPTINWLLLAGVVLLVLGFGSSAALAAAYGLAVSGTMVITSLLVLVVAWLRPVQTWRVAILICIALVVLLEVLFFSANLGKLDHGGWLPGLMGLGIFTLLTTWKRGSAWVAEQRRSANMRIHKFAAQAYPGICRIPRTAVYLVSNPNRVSACLFYNLKHYQALHQQLVFLHVENADIPYIPAAERLLLLGVAPGIYTVTVRVGFRESTNLQQALQEIAALGVELAADKTSFFVARTVITTCGKALPRWRCLLFAWMARQAESAASYFNLPAQQVVEIGL